MKLTFKQFSLLSDLSPEQVTEEKLEEIFGAFFGGKSQAEKIKIAAELKAKKAYATLTPQQKAAKQKQWTDFVAQSKAGNKPNNVVDKHGERRAADFSYAMTGEALEE